MHRVQVRRLRLVGVVLALALPAVACSTPPSAARLASGPVREVRIPIARTTTWHTTELASPRGAMDASLHGLSCASPGNCVGAGEAYYNTADVPQAFTISETNGKWGHPQQLTMPTHSQSASATGVSCAPDGSCLVIGQADGDSGYPFTVSEDHGRWSAVTALATRRFAPYTPTLKGVSCVSDGNCVAVGDVNGSHGAIPLIATETQRIWRLDTVAPPARPPSQGVSVGDVGLSSVACIRAGDCVAAGSYAAVATSSALLIQPMTVAESHGRWLHAQPVPIPADGGPFTVPAAAGFFSSGGTLQDGELESVSCMPQGPCMAVGRYFRPRVYSGMAVSGNDGRWGPPLELPRLDIIGCTAGPCVSLEQPTGGDFQKGPAVAFTYARGHWRRGELIRPPANASIRRAGYRLELAGLSCFPDSGCIAGGSYTDRSGHSHLLVATGL